MATDNPYEAPMTDVSAPAREPALGREYGGIGRLAYFGYSFLLAIVSQIVTGVAVSHEAQAGALVVLAIQFVLGLVLACQRYKNLGASPWWGLTILIPIYNILVMIRCLAYPPGWFDHRRLDTPGKVVVGLILGFVAVIVLLMILSLVLGA